MKMISKIKKAFVDPSLIHDYLKVRSRVIGRDIFRSGYALPPTTIYIAINSACNLRCKMCDFGLRNEGSSFFRHLSAGNKELSFDDIRRLIDEVKTFHPKIAIISAEPLLYRDIIKVIKYIKSAGLKCQLTTNGLILKRFARPLVEAGLDELWISLDGPPKVHDDIRGIPGTFKRAVEGMREVGRFKAKLKQRFPVININFTITDKNFNKLVPFYDMIRKEGVNDLSFSHLNFVEPAIGKEHNRLYGKFCPATPTTIAETDPKKVDCAVLARQIGMIRSKKDALASFVPDISDVDTLKDFYNRPDKFVTRQRCLVPWVSSQILANGDVIPLTRCFNISFGNIHDQSFGQIWNCGKFRRFRKLLRSKGALPACSRCCGVF